MPPDLLSNAIKFSPAGAAVSIRVAAKDGDLRLTVSDSGPGFPDELTSRIGEPFLRLTDANVASAEGSGLGLAITRKLVEQQDGALAICSGADGGTEATITLPVGGPGSRESNVPRSRAGTGPDAVATASPVLLA